MVTHSPTCNQRRHKRSWQSQRYWCYLLAFGTAICFTIFALTRVRAAQYISISSAVARSLLYSHSLCCPDCIASVRRLLLPLVLKGLIQLHKRALRAQHLVRCDSVTLQPLDVFPLVSLEANTAVHNSEGLSGPLDLEQCKHLPQLRMCSHQLKGATTTWGVLAALR